MTSCKWKDGTPLPSTVSATYKGLLKACTEEGVPLGALFAHPDMPLNEHDVTDLQRRIAAMASVHNVQVDMISRLAAERNRLLDFKKWYEEAMAASNEAGYSCQDAASVIRDMAGLLNQKQQEEM